MRLLLNYESADSYAKFLRIKSLPQYGFVGRTAIVPDEYINRIKVDYISDVCRSLDYVPSPFLFDYQADIAATAIRKQKYAIFADCGLGKTLIFLEWAQCVLRAIPEHLKVLIVSPMMVIQQTIDEAERWYPGISIARLRSNTLQHWIENGANRIGIVNYDAISDKIKQSNIGALILDESSILKSHYGKWGAELIRLGKGLDWKLCCTGTPAPNDRIEFANHAVFLDHYPTINSFLARFFVNRGQTSERWVLKSHALKPFYVALSHWCIFLNNPATYGWKHNVEPLPPIQTHIEHIELTGEQIAASQELTGQLIVAESGGIGQRSQLAQIAKGSRDMPTNKLNHIINSLAQWPDEQTIIWCRYNEEQDAIAKTLPDAASVTGTTCEEDRLYLIGGFKKGKFRTLISKPKILGFGLNLQMATRQIFSSLQDSYEEYYQAVKRSNRFGAKSPLHVHIPVTDLEMPMVQNVLNKCERIDSDTKEQERLFKELGYVRHQ